MQSSSASPGGGETERRQEPRASLSMAGCAWAGRSCSPGEPPLRSPWTQKSPRPRSALGALGVLARGAGGEVAATKVRGSPLEPSGPARPVSSTGPADPGLPTCEPPPSRDSIPGTQASSAPPGSRGQKEPGPRDGAAVNHPGLALLSVGLRASSLPARLRRDGAALLPRTGRGPAPRAPSRVLRAPEPRAPRSASALLPAAGALGGARRGAPRRPAKARSSDPRPQRFWRRASLWEGTDSSRKDAGTRDRLSSQELCPQQ